MGKIRAPPTNAVLVVPATLSWEGKQHLVQAMIDPGIAVSEVTDMYPSLATHGAGLQIDLHVLLDGRPPKPPLEEVKSASISRMAHQGRLAEHCLELRYIYIYIYIYIYTYSIYIYTIGPGDSR